MFGFGFALGLLLFYVLLRMIPRALAWRNRHRFLINLLVGILFLAGYFALGYQFNLWIVSFALLLFIATASKIADRLKV